MYGKTDLKEQLERIATQTAPPNEPIMFDDRSTNGTLRIFVRLFPPRARVGEERRARQGDEVTPDGLA